MDTYNAIMERITANATKAKALEEEVKAMPWSKRTDAAIAAKATEAENLKMENRFLSDNAVIAYVAEKLPGIIEVFAKYNGKPYGEKTAAKINDEIKSRFSCSVHISRRYSWDEMFIYPLVNGYTDYRSPDINLYSGCDTRLFDGNKINIEAFKALRIYGGRTYTDDPAAAVAEVRTALAEAKKAFDEYEKALAALNNITPYGTDHIFAAAPAWYKII